LYKVNHNCFLSDAMVREIVYHVMWASECDDLFGDERLVCGLVGVGVGVGVGEGGGGVGGVGCVCVWVGGWGHTA
jgi:hypothetical protein